MFIQPRRQVDSNWNICEERTGESRSTLYFFILWKKKKQQKQHANYRSDKFSSDYRGWKILARSKDADILVNTMDMLAFWQALSE